MTRPSSTPSDSPAPERPDAPPETAAAESLRRELLALLVLYVALTVTPLLLGAILL